MKNFTRNRALRGLLSLLRLSLPVLLLAVMIPAGKLSGQSPQAGTVTVTGIVTDETGTPVAGVSVVAKGIFKGTITDGKGAYTLAVPGDATLEFTFMGYETHEAAVGNRTHIDVSLEPTAFQIDDVVVMGYGNIRRADVTGSVASISANSLAKIPVTTIGDALAGKMAGVQVTTSDGALDADINVRVRNGGSITQDNSPLFIVDGFPVDDISVIPPTDIQSIDVLKEASMTAIYGARGANGVFIITTKGARAGKTSVSFSSYMQVRTLSKKIDLMDPYDFVMMEYEYQLIRSASTSTFESAYGKFEDLDIYKGLSGDDWQDDVLGGHPISQYYNLRIGGGNERTPFVISVTHNNDKGQLVGTGLMRTTANLKLDHKLLDNLRLSTNTTFVHRRIDGSGTSGANVVTALRYRPIQGLRGGREIYDPEEDEVDENGIPINSTYKPSEEAFQNYRQQQLFQINTKGSLTWTIVKPLTFKTEYGIGVDFTGDDRFFGPRSNTARGAGMNNLPSAQRTKGKKYTYRVANTLTYGKTFNRTHTLNVMAGQEINYSQKESSFQSARYFPAEISAKTALENFGMGTPHYSTTETEPNVSLASFFGQLRYDYKQRYYLTATLRADGSSKFRRGNQWGYFPGASVAWKINNEEFMKNAEWVSELKLRLSFGAAGNNRISDNLWRQMYSIETENAPSFNNGEYNYYRFSDTDYLPDPDLTWETTITRNAGVDFGFFNHRLTGTLDVYWNTTKDLLVPSVIPSSSGFLKQMTNVGQTSNRGIELSLNGTLAQTKDFHLSANFNIGYNSNKIDKLASGETEWRIKSGTTEWFTDYDYKMEVGRKMGLIYGFVNDGFYRVSDFEDYATHNGWVLKPDVVNSGIVSTWPMQPGYVKFKKLSPVDPDNPNTYTLNKENDLAQIGDTNPDFSGGFGISSTYKGFDLTLFFNFMYGFDVYNINRMYLTSMWRHNYFNLEKGMTGRFRYMDDNGYDMRKDPAALEAFNRDATTYSPMSLTSGVPMSDLIEDGSFLRLSTVTLGYTLPQSITRKAGISNLRFYVSGNNLWTLTGYSGYDPEVNVQKGMTPGRDYNVYPRSRTFTFGAEINF